MIEVDGSIGEGGGQIVRSALGLSLALQRSVRITNIRAARSRPGLRPQHVTAVEAAATIGRADVSDVEEGAEVLTFNPTTVAPGRYHFDVGTAGSTILVLQTVLPGLLTADAPSTITVTGGTHVRFAPPFDFFALTFLPLLQRMGPVLRASVDRLGFYPKGGGRCTLEVEPAGDLGALDLVDRGSCKRRRARALVANLPRHIAERELATVQEELPVELDDTRIETPSAFGAGNALLLELAFENVTEVVSGIGERGKPAETVATEVVDEARRYLASDAPVGPHLADQLLIPLALGGGTFRAATLTAHTHTNAAVIEHFVSDRLSITEAPSGWLVSSHQ